MNRLKLLLCLLSISLIAIAQNKSHIIKGIVIDADTKEPLEYVNVQVDEPLRNSLTDSLGRFEISINEHKGVLKITYMGYETKAVPIDLLMQKKLVISLTQQNIDLREIVVSSSKLDTVSNNKSSYVLDYNFYDNNILIVIYGSSVSKAKLLLLSPDLDTLSVVYISDEPIKLYKDCLHKTHLFCKNKVYQIFFDAGGLKLTSLNTKNEVEKYLVPCVANDSTNLYIETKYGSELITNSEFHDFMSNNYGVQYFYINKGTKTKKSLINVIDKKTIAMRKEEEIAQQKKKQEGVSTFGNKVFTETILFKEIFAPLYVIDNNVLIFDYVNDSLLSFDSNGKLRRKISILYHKKRNWKRKMCIDVKTKKIYTLFEQNGITELRQIDINNGAVLSTKKIPFPFISNIKVQNNRIYFLYKNRESDDTNYLMRLAI